MTIGEADTRDRPRRSTAGTLLYVLFGPIVWAAHLGIIYFAQSMLCAHGAAGRTIFGAGVIPVFIGAATALALALLGAAILAPGAASRLARASGWSAPDRTFHARTMVTLAVLSAIGVALAGATTLVVPACPGLR